MAGATAGGQDDFAEESLRQTGRRAHSPAMTFDTSIAPMTHAELEMVLEWAAEEGWNPGLDDAAAFHAADPAGFLLLRTDGEPASAISVVNHSASIAFLGLYLCRPKFRGRGLGLAVWNAGLEHAGTRSVVLDGVPAQQDNYRRSGFTPLGRTVRYRGTLTETGPAPRPMTPADLASMLAADAHAAGHDRAAYKTGWFNGAPTRHTRVLGPPGAPEAWATGRTCREGTKIGPLHATTGVQALALIAAFTHHPIFIDVPESSALTPVLASRGFVPVFDTARMVRGPAPKARPPAFQAVATLELG
jgi:ribosomal protein S18 acetylase RimI-like enzyme